VRKRYVVELMVGPLDEDTSTRVAGRLAQGSRLPGCSGRTTAHQRSAAEGGEWLVIHGGVRAGAGLAACDAFATAVQRAVGEAGVGVLPIAHRSASQVYYQGGLRWGTGEGGTHHEDDLGAPIQSVGRLAALREWVPRPGELFLALGAVAVIIPMAHYWGPSTWAAAFRTGLVMWVFVVVIFGFARRRAWKRR